MLPHIAKTGTCRWTGYVFFAPFCPKQGRKIDGVVLQMVGIFGFLCPKQGQGSKPSAALLYPKIDQVPPGTKPSRCHFCYFSSDYINFIDDEQCYVKKRG